MASCLPASDLLLPVPDPARGKVANHEGQTSGVRGTTPTPERGNGRYGGNTSCVEVRLDNDILIILDCGSGLRALGKSLLRQAMLDALLGDSKHYFGSLDNERKLPWIANPESDDEILPVIERGRKPAIFLFVQCRAGDSKFSGKRLPDQ